MDVTLLEALPRILQRVTSETVSEFFTQVHREESVDLRTNAVVKRIVGDAAVTGVELENGEVIETELVVVGIGILPDTDLAEAAGLEVDNGICVDEYARTSDPEIYAIGDCSCFEHPHYARRLRLESVQNANDQAVVAARSIVGKPEAYAAVPWFWSDQYDVKLQIAGLADGAEQQIERRDANNARSVSVLYLKDNRLLAVDAMNRPHDFVFGKKLIVEQREVDLQKLADPNTPLKDAGL